MIIDLQNQTDRFYAILCVFCKGELAALDFVEPKRSITTAVNENAAKWPGCKIKVFERSYDRSYFVENIDAIFLT